MATGDLRTKFREYRSSGSRDMVADRQTHIQTGRLITILCTPTGQSNNYNRSYSYSDHQHHQSSKKWTNDRSFSRKVGIISLLFSCPGSWCCGRCSVLLSTLIHLTRWCLSILSMLLRSPLTSAWLFKCCYPQTC